MSGAGSDWLYTNAGIAAYRKPQTIEQLAATAKFLEDMRKAREPLEQMIEWAAIACLGRGYRPDECVVEHYPEGQRFRCLGEVVIDVGFSVVFDAEKRIVTCTVTRKAGPVWPVKRNP